MPINPCVTPRFAARHAKTHNITRLRSEEQQACVCACVRATANPCLCVMPARQPVVKKKKMNSPAWTEDTDRNPARSSSSAAAENRALAILLRLRARLHILRGPFRSSHPPGWSSRHPGRYRREGSLREEEEEERLGTSCADEAHLNLEAAAEAQQWEGRKDGGRRCKRRRKGRKMTRCSRLAKRPRTTGGLWLERRRGGALLRAEVSGA